MMNKIQKYKSTLYILHGIRATIGSKEFLGFWVLFLGFRNSNLVYFQICIVSPPTQGGVHSCFRLVHKVRWLDELHLSLTHQSKSRDQSSDLESDTLPLRHRSKCFFTDRTFQRLPSLSVHSQVTLHLLDQP